jgi:putative transposon-encoded protein
MPKLEIDFEKYIEKKVSRMILQDNEVGRVYLPASWIGKKVIIVVPKEI